eukprot:353613-Chlamydomonas_euryale.AAC.3
MGAAFHLPMHGHTGAPRAARIRLPLNTDSQTINHAELNAIYAAIVDAENEPRSIYVATDSAAALAQIGKMVRQPALLRYQKHKSLLTRILDCLRARLNQRYGPVEVLKVKSHSGIIGNEMADAAAKEAAEGTTYTEIRNSCLDNPPRTVHWLYATRRDDNLVRREPTRRTAQTSDAQTLRTHTPMETRIPSRPSTPTMHLKAAAEHGSDGSVDAALQTRRRHTEYWRTCEMTCGNTYNAAFGWAGRIRRVSTTMHGQALPTASWRMET